MEVKPGYKLTEAGVIPEDWDSGPIGEAGQVLGGRQRSPNRVGELCNYLRVANVFDGFINTDDILKMPFTPAEKNRFLLKEGDVLLNEGQSIDLVGRSAIYRGSPPDCCFQNTLVRFRANPGTSPGFAQLVFQQYLRTGIFASIALQTTSIAHLGASRLAVLAMPMPKKAEQDAIARALNDADALIESLERLIAKKRDIKQGATQELLRPRRGWTEKAIGDLLTIHHGRSQRGVAALNGRYPILASGGQIGTADRFLYDKPSVLIGRKGTIDRPQYTDQPFWAVDTLFYSAVREPNNPRYMFYQFCLIDWRRHNEASGVPSLNARTIENIELKIPAPDEQTAIAATLSEMDIEIATLGTKLTKARQIKQGMMQNLLTGKIRLV
jgi:type I restriction enzyme S subunit